MTALLLTVIVAAAPLLASGWPHVSAGRPVAPSMRARAAAPLVQTYSSDWKRLRSAHFIAVGNADYVAMRRVLTELEGFRQALLRSSPSLRVASPAPLTVVVFKDEGSFARFRPRDSAGRRRDSVAAYLLSGADASYLVLPMHRDAARTFHYLFHEYTHFIVRQTRREVPEWLNEGLAEFYSTFRATPREGRSILGEPPQNRLPVLRSGRQLPLRDVLTMGSGERAAAAAPRQQLFYAWSWALVHFLTLGEGGRHQSGIQAYLAALDGGAALDTAVASAFDMPLEALERAVARYAQQPTLPTVVLDEPQDGVRVRTTVEALRESDVTLLQRTLLDLLRQ